MYSKLKKWFCKEIIGQNKSQGAVKLCLERDDI
jgi:hypothetical protein